MCSQEDLSVRSPSVGSLEEGNYFGFESPNSNQDVHRKYSETMARSVSPLEDAIYNDEDQVEETCSPIWCLACNEEVLIVGCADGKIEVSQIVISHFQR